MSEMKTCASCHAAKPIEDFARQGRRPRHSYCKACFNARYRGVRRRPISAAAKRAHNLRARYGLTLDEVKAMLAAQGGICALCDEVPDPPCVDHDHQSGAVRGVLCTSCNLKLGTVEDGAFVARALAYLDAAKPLEKVA